MSWLRIDDNAPSHRKILRAPPAARWVWVCGLAYCQRHRTDGHIPAEALATFAVDKPKPLADALVAAGLWHVTPDGWRVHDFLDWNDSADEREAKTAEKGERQRRWRERRRNSPVSADAHVDASTWDSGDAAPTPTPSPSPSPTPRPIPSPDGDGRAGARRGHLAPTAPGGVDRHHGKHALRDLLCDWVCLPEVVFEEWVTRLAGAGSTRERATADIREWAADVKARWQQSGKVPGDSIFDFWRHEWTRTWGTNRPSTAPRPGAGLEALMSLKTL